MLKKPIAGDLKIADLEIYAAAAGDLEISDLKIYAAAAGDLKSQISRSRDLPPLTRFLVVYKSWPRRPQFLITIFRPDLKT